MSRAVSRLFLEWWEETYGEDYPTGTEFDQDDMGDAFGAGWDAALSAEWVDADGKVVARVVGGEQPVRASSDESQQPRDDPATPEGPG